MLTGENVKYSMEVYNKVRDVPKTAQKLISAGRLRGYTDINPMWRIEKLTEIYGMCGFGWKYEIVNERLEQGADGNISAFVDINLYVKVVDEWSAAIPGIGGSSFVTKESKGLYTDDDCFKKALTDAISIACKSLGFGADIYYANSESKYSATQRQETSVKQEQQQKPKYIICELCGNPIYDSKKGTPAHKVAEMTKDKTGKSVCEECYKEWMKSGERLV